MSVSDHYNVVCSVRRFTLTHSDTVAYPVEAWEDVEQDVQFCIQPVTARELNLWGKTTAEVSHTGYREGTGLDIRPRDVLYVGNPIESLFGLGDGEYEVIGVTDAAGKAHHLELMLLQRVEQE